MSVIFLSTKNFPSGEIIEFNIEAAKEKKNKDIKAINDELTFLEELSFGKISMRRDNGELWYIDPSDTVARFITKEQLDLFRKWDKQTLLPTDEQFEILKEIGGLPSSQYSLDPENLQFPATITTNGGQQIDLCLIHFSEAPPFQSYFKRVTLLDEIADIKPSELSLNHNLRLASTLSDEIRMGFSPFMVTTNAGDFITYNGKTQFASTGKLKGNEIVSEAEFSFDRFDKVNDVSFDNITFVIGKWDNRLQNLFIQYRQRVDRKIEPTVGVAKGGVDGKTMGFWNSIKKWLGLWNKA